MHKLSRRMRKVLRKGRKTGGPLRSAKVYLWRHAISPKGDLVPRGHSSANIRVEGITITKHLTRPVITGVALRNGISRLSPPYWVIDLGAGRPRRHEWRGIHSVAAAMNGDHLLICETAYGPNPYITFTESRDVRCGVPKTSSAWCSGNRASRPGFWP